MLALLLSPVATSQSVCTQSSPPRGRTCALAPSPAPHWPPPAFPVKQAPWQLVLSLVSANDLSQPSSVKPVLTGFRIQGSHVFHSMALRMFFHGRRASLIPGVAAPLSLRPAVRDVPSPTASSFSLCLLCQLLEHDVSRRGSLRVCCSGSLIFLDLWFGVSNQIWKHSSLVQVNVFFCVLLLSFPSGTPLPCVLDRVV